MPTILGANTADDSYEISNSLRLNDGDSPRLNRTTTTATNDDKATLSVWAKRGTNFGSSQNLIGWNSGNSAQAYFRIFNGSDNVQLFNKHSTESNTSVIASAKLRDPSAWYHIVLKYDAAQSTSSERVKIYINGTEQTLGTTDYPPQNTPLGFNYGSRDIFLACWNNSSEFVDGYISEFAFLDGQALDPTYFGETNNNGVWIPKEFKDDVTFGNNGFYLEFKQTGTGTNSSGIGADTSGNDNHFSVTNLAALDVTVDTPTNNFCTLNPLYQQGSNTFSEGNCKVVLEAGDGSKGVAGGIAPANGKWYWEVKQGSATNSSILVREASDKEDDLSYYQGNFAGYVFNNGNQNITGNTNSTYGPSYSSGDIIMVAMDMDNDRVYFGKNGSWIDGSGNADESSINDFVPLNGIDNGLGAFANANSGATATAEFNWGNPSFSISSGNADANGYGNFEYAVPSGYYALCTKNLAEYG